MAYVWVGLGGTIGALLRYQLSKWIGERIVVSFPLATLIINVTGAFLLGFFTRSLGHIFPHLGSAPMLLLGTGLCGAYTTFSTFSYELVILLRESRYAAAGFYLAASLVFGLAAAGVGLYGLPGSA
ncbi:fluoride efflux transporter CrcB [Alicyclobacillus tolerans]|uniref:fluoride efflux transporter CrcB n=1 Tax=Alicyclobacillus tolerans TaxID=90970 RepID=UPI001F00948F|nr:fluoride efflux transporter CrcB [Alicyclobacillus tolerans]MCF8563291.1 fluoride efflux transporter CrcB [Alicyclobacillus tolerans]